MHQKIKLLPALCIAATLILLGLQGYWITKYYNVTKQTFEKEVNLAFEDAFKKEFSLRTDSIQQLIKQRLLDTNQFLITSSLGKENEVVYKISETKNPKDYFSNSFSSSKLKVMITAANKKIMVDKVAEHFSKMLRNEDLDNRIIYYRTQELGKYMFDLTKKLDFDTANLRPILNKYLAEKSIYVKYQFYAKQKDSTTNKSTFSPSLLQKFPVITRSLPTYNQSLGQNYIRVMFTDPYPYILSNMWLILSSSIFLVFLIGFCLAYLLHILNKEKKLSSIKNDFISNITHEFKTPVATAMIAIEALNDPNVRRDEDKTIRYLKHTKNELNRISELTDQVLKISLYDSENFKLNKAQIHLETIVKEVIEIYQLSEKNPVISFQNSTSISEILADQSQFQHALSNVIDNAIKYGINPIQIDISCQLEQNYLTTIVKDNGPGIATAEIPFVFEKFYRAKQHHEQVIKGYGLGLNYVKQIMDQHQGWYKLSSDKNGTEVKLGWPI